MKTVIENKELEFNNVDDKYQYVYNAINKDKKTIATVAKELGVSNSRITGMCKLYLEKVNYRHKHADLYNLLGEETRIVTALARARINSRKLKDMYMEDSSLNELRKVRDIGNAAIKKIIKCMK